MKSEKIIQIDLANIRSLASPKLFAEMQASEQGAARDAEELKASRARLAEVEAAILGLSAQEAQLAAKRNAANELAERLQDQMVEALAAGQDVEKLSDEYAQAMGAAAKHHGIIAACEKNLAKRRPERDALLQSVNRLAFFAASAARSVAYNNYRLALGSFMRQAADVFGLSIMHEVHDRARIFGGHLAEMAISDVKPIETELDKAFAELGAMDKQSVETVQAFVTEQPKAKSKGKGEKPEPAPAADEPVELGAGLPESAE